MNYDYYFSEQLKRIKKEGNYRTFNTIQRIRGDYPKAMYLSPNGETKKITVWCSNDYLGMGQHPVVVEAAQLAIKESGVGAGGTRNIGVVKPAITSL